jgi:hypothetical protein
MPFDVVPKGQFILEQRFERRFLYPFNAVLAASAIAAIVGKDWAMLGICLVASFLIGLIAMRLPKNRWLCRLNLNQSRRGRGLGEMLTGCHRLDLHQTHF